MTDLGRAVIVALALVGVGIIVWQGVWWVLIRLSRWGGDPMIDDLIAQNRPQSDRSLRYYEPMDWQKMNRLGERTWQERLRAQRRRQQGDVQEFPRRVKSSDAVGKYQ